MPINLNFKCFMIKGTEIDLNNLQNFKIEFKLDNFTEWQTKITQQPATKGSIREVYFLEM